MLRRYTASNWIFRGEAWGRIVYSDGHAETINFGELGPTFIGPKENFNSALMTLERAVSEDVIRGVEESLREFLDAYKLTVVTLSYMSLTGE